MNDDGVVHVVTSADPDEAWQKFELEGVPVVVTLAPLITSALAGRRWRLLVWASYAGALMLPVATLQVAAYLPYLAIENLVWAIVDLPKGKGSPVVGPTDVRNIRRVAG